MFIFQEQHYFPFPSIKKITRYHPPTQMPRGMLKSIFWGDIIDMNAPIQCAVLTHLLHLVHCCSKDNYSKVLHQGWGYHLNLNLTISVIISGKEASIHTVSTVTLNQCKGWLYLALFKSMVSLPPPPKHSFLYFGFLYVLY